MLNHNHIDMAGHQCALSSDLRRTDEHWSDVNMVCTILFKLCFAVKVLVQIRQSYLAVIIRLCLEATVIAWEPTDRTVCGTMGHWPPRALAKSSASKASTKIRYLRLVKHVLQVAFICGAYG